MRKRVIVFLLSAMMFLSMVGCKTNKLMQDAQNELPKFENTELADLDVSNNKYGTPAEQYLTYIQNHFPGRIAGSQKEKEMAVFILDTLLEGGYKKENIKIQNFRIDENSAPAQAVEKENAYSGGVSNGESNNIEVIKKGKSKSTILVGAHYDSVGTHGVVDNGSGVSVVLENALRMEKTESPYTIKYVFFGAEEIGMYGSRFYVDQLSQKERDAILLMINVDCVVGGDIPYIYGGSVGEKEEVRNTWLVEYAYQLAQELELEIQLPPKGNSDYPFPTGQKRSDFAPFSDIGIPYIYFEANNWEKGYPEETEKYGIITHTRNDNLNFINRAFPKRVQETLSSYSELLHGLVKNDIEVSS